MLIRMSSASISSTRIFRQLVYQWLLGEKGDMVRKYATVSLLYYENAIIDYATHECPMVIIEHGEMARHVAAG